MDLGGENMIKKILLMIVILFVTALIIPKYIFAQSYRMVYIHESCGENWLNDGLFDALERAGIEVHSAGPENDIAKETDICKWNQKFKGNLKQILYFDKSPNVYYDDQIENDIVMISSSFTGNDITSNGSPAYANPDDCTRTVANYQVSYNALKEVFASYPDKLFIIVTAPPLAPSQTTEDIAKRAVFFNDWLRSDYLTIYYSQTRLKNVFVFDLFGILINEYGVLREEFQVYSDDSHPNRAANETLTQDFIPFLKSAIKLWKKGYL